MSTFLRYVSFISLYFDNRHVICLCESLHIWILKSPKDQREMSGVAYASMDADKKTELLAKNRRRLWNKRQLLSSSSTSSTHVSASGKYPHDHGACGGCHVNMKVLVSCTCVYFLLYLKCMHSSAQLVDFN